MLEQAYATRTIPLHAAARFAEAGARVHPLAERRRPALPGGPWLAAMIDEIDYGMLLLVEGQVVHANKAARATLQASPALRLAGSELQPRSAGDGARLRAALADAQRGLRRLLSLGDPADPLTLAVLPLPATDPGSAPATLLTIGKRHVCQELSVQAFASGHGLTQAETNVLKSLCAGVAPSEIARRQQVALSTIRTHIERIRMKIGAPSIGGIVRQVSTLPPLLGVLALARREEACA